MAVLLALDHVQLAAPAGCEAAARAFYGTVLDLPEVEKPEGVRASGGVWFGLAGRQQLHIGVEAGFAPAHKAHPALRLETPAALEALAARVADAGGPVTWDRRIAGVRRFFTQDPWGNRLELLASA